MYLINYATDLAPWPRFWLHQQDLRLHIHRLLHPLALDSVYPNRQTPSWRTFCIEVDDRWVGRPCTRRLWALAGLRPYTQCGTVALLVEALLAATRRWTLEASQRLGIILISEQKYNMQMWKSNKSKKADKLKMCTNKINYFGGWQWLKFTCFENYIFQPISMNQNTYLFVFK